MNGKTGAQTRRHQTKLSTCLTRFIKSFQTIGERGVISILLVNKYLNIVVEVRNEEDMSLITSLNTDQNVAGNTETRRPCRMCQHGKTLAVLCANRRRVRLFNTETDELVGEIETALGGPVYNIAISDKLLVLLSGSSSYHLPISLL